VSESHKVPYNREYSVTVEDAMVRVMVYDLGFKMPTPLPHPLSILHSHSFTELFVCTSGSITICTENMWQCYGDSSKIWDSTCSRAEEFARYIDGVGSPFVKACVDIGHTVLVGENPVKMIKTLGHRIAALHVHDNDGIHDTHTLPFHGIIKWDEVAKALKDIDYKGELTLETEGFFLKSFPVSLYPDAVKYMAASARRLCDMIDNA
jgi:hypothetical protein